MKQQRPRIKKARKEPAREIKPRTPPNRTLPFWGRGASPHRPGLFIWRYLKEHGEACAADIYYALSQEIMRLNEERVEIGEKPIRRSNYSSFARYFHWFKLLGLVEPTSGREPAIYDFLEQRVFYRLTAQGTVETEAWRDPIARTHPEFR